ncbi:MAG: phosphomethylpyrimidine synthase ThiC [Candidatus Margulisbacteria bacterium]|nr:phosphomethylpyrimidine synthase ThiC [Candidatus Margulisiibacteriota bacterium]
MIDSKIIAENVYQELAKQEGVSVQTIKDLVTSGTGVVLGNPKHTKVKPVAVGKGLRVKINANIGVSPATSSVEEELAKVKLCEETGVHCLMDLSLGKDIRQLRKDIINSTYIPVGTVPLYGLFFEKPEHPEDMIERFLEILEESGQDGVDFVVIHAGILKSHIELTKSRLIPVTSRGGSLLMKWMKKWNKENFLYENFNQILAICKKYNMTISLGDGMRPATIIDETDEAQLEEMRILGDLVLRCRKAGVQCMVEGPGHIPFHRIKLNIDLQKEYCHGAPFYVLGPLVTDVAPGYDHITSAIGATMAAYSGADFLCYVTPSEHLALPDLKDVRDGIMAYKIAAHAADLTRGKDLDWDRQMSKARAEVDWKKQRELAMDTQKFDEYFSRRKQNYETCTMCGEFCALK